MCGVGIEGTGTGRRLTIGPRRPVRNCGGQHDVLRSFYVFEEMLRGGPFLTNNIFPISSPRTCAFLILRLQLWIIQGRPLIDMHELATTPLLYTYLYHGLRALYRGE